MRRPSKLLLKFPLGCTFSGSLDGQSLSGKAPVALANAAKERDIPVIVVAGRIMVPPQELASRGVVASAQLVDFAQRGNDGPDIDDAVANAATFLELATNSVLRGPGRLPLHNRIRQTVMRA